MAKVQIKNLRSAFNAVEKLFNTTLEQDVFLEKVANYAKTEVVAQTRIGKDLSEEGQPIKGHSEGTTRFRKRIAEGRISDVVIDLDFFRAGKSNITFSGQLLNSIKYFIFKNKKQIEIRPTGQRFKTGTAKYFKNSDELDTNAAVAADLRSRGFTFLGLADKQIRFIRKLVLDEIRRAIRRRG